MRDIFNRLRVLSTVPSREGGAYDAWLEQADALAFLADNLNENDFVVYASLPHSFICAVLVPAGAVSPPDIEDLMAWSVDPYSSWGVTYSFSDPSSVSISQPLDSASGNTFVNGEQLVFVRSFEGDDRLRPYIEILQKFAHIFDMHFVAERKAYCTLDRHGDVKDVVRIVTIGAEGEYHGGTVVTFDRQLLNKYAALTDAAVVRMFDFSRYEPGQFGDWDIMREERQSDGDDLFYRFGIARGHASYARGCQIVRTEDTRQAIFERFQGDMDRSERQYASFIGQDWKNDRVEEISCDPSKLANYFTESDLPFAISPAFFRSEVLLKYKADSEKYKLGERSITCRGAWHLQTYDVNEASQVHTYLKYLGDLPYEEQLHWKQYNELPKAPISKRAFTTDMKGEFYDEYDALMSVKRKLLELHRRAVPWWALRSDDVIDRTHYPVTAATDEWREGILALDQLLVEGFQEKWLRKKAKQLGRSPELSSRSLKLIEECLIGLGFEEDHARSVISPLRDAHYLRSKLKGHVSGDTAKSISSTAISNHGTYRKHFENLCTRCDEAMELIVEAFQDPRMS